TTPATPTWDLSASGKLKFGLRKAYLSPVVYIFPLFTTIRQQIGVANQPHKDFGDKAADDLSRYAINFGTASTKNLFALGIYPIVFHQNPHYIPSNKKGFWPRTLYAV